MKSNLGIIAVIAFFCVTQETAAEVSVSTKRPISEITKPGAVAVDVPTRRNQLSQLAAMHFCPSSLPFGTAPVYDSVLDLTDNGVDERYNLVSAHFRKLGAACVGGVKDSCEFIYDYALDWAQNSKLGRPKGGKDADIFWTYTLTGNMRLLSPMLAALGVAEQVSPLPKSQRKILDKWVKKKVRQYEHGMRAEGSYKGGKHGTTARKAAHNYAVQSSIVAMSYGAWSNNKRYFKTGIEQWFITLNSMRKDGSLPIEARRGARALFYSGRTLSGLVQLAERAAVQGIDLYNTAPKMNKTIHHAVAFFIDAVEDPDLILKYAKINHYPGPSKNYKSQDLGNLGSTLGWIAPYIRRFPDHPNSQRLRKMSFEHKNYLTRSLASAVRMNGFSSEWIGVDARCFYADPHLP